MTPQPGTVDNADEGDVEPLPENVASIQPGGGVCMSLELRWGRVRRWYLKTFRASYVRRMRELRTREPQGCPHEVLDPRDVKFYRNVTGDCWRPGDDPFVWRDRLPLARVGLGELVILSSCLLLAAAASLWVFWPLAVAAVGLAAFVVSFFRDPRRAIPSESGVVVSPADGKVVTVREIDADDYLGGPAVEIGIFLSVFNVHVNRSPAESRVMGITYTPGKFLNALRPRSAQENERVTVRLQELAEPHRRYVVRQITGAIARRIVCWARPGDRLARGARFGMIKLGSRTELVLPRRDNLVVDVRVGQRVKAGSSVVARYQ